MTDEEHTTLAHAGLRQADEIAERLQWIRFQLSSACADLDTLKGVLLRLASEVREGATNA